MVQKTLFLLVIRYQSLDGQNQIYKARQGPSFRKKNRVTNDRFHQIKKLFILLFVSFKWKR